MKRPETFIVDRYAAAEGFALKTFFIDCIRRGNRMDIENQLDISRYREQMNELFCGNKEDMVLGLMLAWAQYERAAVEGGVEEAAASEYYVKYAHLANNADSICTLTDLSIGLLLELADAVANAQKQYGNHLLIFRCQEIIRDRIYEKITVQELAEQFHFSRSYFSQCFKKATGESIQQFIQREKIAEAKRLIRFTSLSIITIGNRLGFCSQSYFTSVFKQMCGMTPSQYRNGGSNENDPSHI